MINIFMKTLKSIVLIHILDSIENVIVLIGTNER